MENIVFYVSLLLGVLLLLVVIINLIRNKYDGFAGVSLLTVAMIVGTILIGMPVWPLWKSVDFQVKDFRVRLVKAEQEIKEQKLEFKNIKNAIANYQALHGIKPTGIIDDNTLNLLNNKKKTGKENSGGRCRLEFEHSDNK